MQNDSNMLKKNPLTSFMRQPKIYITLPSKGKFWPEGSIDYPENGEFAVYSMTAKDELIFKTPDALMNGQAIVDVIQSCIPNIKNAWVVPSIDLDTILIAIRIATYGEKMVVTHKIPKIEEEVEHEIDLRILLDQQSNNIWENHIEINSNLSVFVKPLTYKHITQTGIKTFETNRILVMVNDQNIPDDEKLRIFNESFNNLTKVTIELISDTVYKVVADGQEVTEPVFIKEFVNNIDKDVFEKINNHLTTLKKANEIKPFTFTTTEEQQKAGAPADYEVPITFNNSDFFV